MNPASLTARLVTKVTSVDRHQEEDLLAIEEPLEIRLLCGEYKKSVSITMRTPGFDAELAAGFLFTEGLVRNREAIETIEGCGPKIGSHGGQNIVRVQLKPGTPTPDLKVERHFFMTSSCGICGKASLEALEVHRREPFPTLGPAFDSDVIHTLPKALMVAQAVFEKTGGLHAAGLFDETGNLLNVHEDVGRHNAVDKAIGCQFLKGNLPLFNRILFVSGRASFELMQKALMAGIPTLAAVGAPSSLAVELASKFNMTLLGFVRDQRFNIYYGGWRLR